jgi:hypothetical protein
MKRKQHTTKHALQEITCYNRRTFTSTNDYNQLILFCRDLVKQTVDDLISDRILCKRIVLKLKTANFEILTRSKTLSTYTDSLNVLTEKALSLLKHELDQQYQLPALRLMGRNISLVDIIK